MTASRMLSPGLALGMILLQPVVHTGHTAAGGDSAPATRPKPAPSLPAERAAAAKNVAMSQDGKLRATVLGTTVILSDAATGKQLRILRGHTGRIASLALSANGKQVVTGSVDKTAILWDAATGKKLQTFEHAWMVLSVLLSADGKQVVTGYRLRETIVWDAATGKKLEHLIGTREHRTARSADGKYELTASNATAILCETTRGRQIQTFKGHDVGINCLAISPDGTKVFTVDADPVSLAYYVIVWEAASGKKRLTFQVLPPQAPRREKSTWVICMAVSIDGDQILTGCEDGTTTLWDTATGKLVHNFQGHTKQVTEVALSAYGQFAWSASDDGTARLWDIKSGKEVKPLVIPDTKSSRERVNVEPADEVDRAGMTAFATQCPCGRPGNLSWSLAPKPCARNPGTMLDGLHRIQQSGGRLLGADYALVEGKREWLTAIALRFENLTAVFRVRPEDDSISLSFGEMQVEDNESVVPSGEVSFWAQCIGAPAQLFL